MPATTLALTIGAQTIGRTKNPTLGNVNRVLAALRAKYPAATTDAEAVLAQIDDWLVQLRSETVIHERKAAAANAETGVPGVDFPD